MPRRGVQTKRGSWAGMTPGRADRYLLCYADRIVEIYFNWTPTDAQKAIVGEKSGQSVIKKH